MTANEIIKEWLLRYRESVGELEMIESRIALLRSRMRLPNRSNLDGMPKQTGYIADRMGENISLLDELEQEAEAARIRMRERYREIDTAIKGISGRCRIERQTVLQMRYLDLAAWEEITVMLYGKKEDFADRPESFDRRTFRVHADALKALAEILPLHSMQEQIEKGRE